ncbi:TPA: hypothetical protein ACMDNU_003660 [Vibrio cholerae]
MLGFVSALSSAVAVMILIMTTLLINLGVVMIKKEEEVKTIRIDKIEVNDSEAKSESKESVKNILSGLSISSEELRKIKSSNEKNLVVYCEYGKNLSNDVARKISTLNYIRLKMVIEDANIELKSPVLSESSTNTCYIEKK